MFLFQILVNYDHGGISNNGGNLDRGNLVNTPCSVIYNAHTGATWLTHRGNLVSRIWANDMQMFVSRDVGGKLNKNVHKSNSLSLSLSLST